MRMAGVLRSFYQTALPFTSWLLLAFQGPVAINGQGVFLRLNGVRLPRNSLVDIDDMLDELTVGFDTALANALMCVTDLVQCCNAGQQNLPQSLGEWYYPNGSLVEFGASDYRTFRRNRGQSVIRLWRNNNPMERGRFRCELPNAQNVSQIRYVNMLDIGGVSVSPAGTTTRTAGENFNLQCSADITPNPLPENVPTPSFEWFFGSSNASLPSGATVSSVTRSGNTYTSTLHFSPLQESHAGMYTCRLGGNARLANNAIITVNGPSIIVTVTHDRGPELGSMYVLICGFSGTERLNPTITYQWTRDNGTTQTVGTNSNTLSFSPLSLSDTGRYTCSVTVSSPYLNSDVPASSGNSQTVMFQIPNPTVTINSNPPSPILDGTNVTLTCSVTMGQGVLPSDLSLLMVDTQLSRDGTTLNLTGPVVSGTTFTYTIRLDSFGRNDSAGSMPAQLMCTSSFEFSSQSVQCLCPMPVEVSWSPPSGGAATITGYRIFYGNGENVLVPSKAITYVGLIFNESAVGQRVSIRSEADKIISELINVTITAGLTKSCSTEVGIAVGVNIPLVLCLVAMVIIVITICFLRKDNQSRNIGQSVYEEPDKLASSGQGKYELTQCPAYESTITATATTNRRSEQPL